MSRRRLQALEIGIPALLISIVWLWSVGAESAFFPPAPRVMAAFLGTWFGAGFLEDVVPSLRRWMIGYSLAGLSGVTVGVVVGLSSRMRWALNPVLDFMRATPPPALVPIALVIFGLGDTMKIALIVLVCVFPILLNTATGVHDIDSVKQETAYVYGVPLVARLFRIVLPAASPQIFAGLRIGCSLGLTVIVLSEMVASTNGIGHHILFSLRAFNLADMWSGVLLIAMLGYGVNIIFDVLERRALRWHHGALTRV